MSARRGSGLPQGTARSVRAPRLGAAEAVAWRSYSSLVSSAKISSMSTRIASMSSLPRPDLMASMASGLRPWLINASAWSSRSTLASTLGLRAWRRRCCAGLSAVSARSWSTGRRRCASARFSGSRKRASSVSTNPRTLVSPSSRSTISARASLRTSSVCTIRLSASAERPAIWMAAAPARMSRAKLVRESKRRRRVNWVSLPSRPRLTNPI